MTKHSGLRAFRAQCYAMAAIGATLALAALAPAAQADDDVRISLKGRVGAVCVVNGGTQVVTPVTIDSVNAAGGTSVEYPINCNAPFAYEVTSRNGGLKRTSPLSGAYPTRVYNLNVNIPTDTGAINDTCASDAIKDDLISCPLSDSGYGVAIAKVAKLSVAWGGGPALPAGTYSDRITFTVMLKQ